MIDLGEAVLHAPALVAEPGELIAVELRRVPGRGTGRPHLALFATLSTFGCAPGLDALWQLSFRSASPTALRPQSGATPAARAWEWAWRSARATRSPPDQQAVVLALVGSCRDGVAVTEAGMLSPVQSLSLLVALGRNLRRRSAARPAATCCPSRDRCTVK